MSTNGFDVAAAVSSMVLPEADRQQEIETLKNQLVALQQDNKQLTWKLDQAQRFDRQKNLVVRKIYQEAKGEELPTGYDTDEMYDRIVELVESDEADTWTVEQDFDVSISFTVTVRGTITAKTEDEAREKLEADLPELELSCENALDGAYISNVDCDDIDLD